MCSVKKTTQHTPVLESVFNKIAQALLKRGIARPCTHLQLALSTSTQPHQHPSSCIHPHQAQFSFHLALSNNLNTIRTKT